MNDDFNTPILIAHLFEAVKYINHIKEGTETISEQDLETFKTNNKRFCFDILGLKNDKAAAELEQIN